MAIRDVVTAGFGSWQTDTHYIPTLGYEPGAEVQIWTQVTPQTGGWGAATDDSSVWLVVPPQTGGWA